MAANATKSKVTREKLLSAALDLATNTPWHEVSLTDISKKLDVSLDTVFDLIEDKDDILVMFGRHIDRAVLMNLDSYGSDENPKDILFDILMERFEVLNEYRPSLISILNSFKSDPKQLVMSGPHMCKSMTWMAEAAQIEVTGWRGVAKIIGLTGVYLNALRVWVNDESPDMAKTMAAVDKSLTHLDGLLGLVSLNKGASKADATTQK